MKKIFSIIMIVMILGVNTNIYAETIKDMKKSIDATQSEYNQKSKELENKKINSKKLIEEIAQTEKDIKKTQSDIITTENSIDQTKMEIKDLEENQIPLMAERAKISLRFTQQKESSNFIIASLIGQASNNQGNAQEIIDHVHSAEKITSEVSKSVDSLSKVLIYVNNQKSELVETKNSLKIREQKLQAQQNYLEDSKNRMSQEMAKIEKDMSASKEELEAEKQKQKLYEEAGCGPNDIYGVDCGAENIENNVVSSGGTGFSRPTNSGYISNEYGYSDFYYTGIHSGIDIANAAGTTIHPTASGVVLYSGWTSDGGGNSVVVLHLINGKNYVTRYAHMQSTSVRTGQQVSRSSVLGKLGNTGNSFGAHLHFEIKSGSTYVWSALENPRNYVNFPSTGVWW